MHLKSDGISFQRAGSLFRLTCIYAVANTVWAAGLTIPPVATHSHPALRSAASRNIAGGGGNSAVVPMVPIMPQSVAAHGPSPVAGFTFKVVAVGHPSGIFQVNQTGSVDILIRNNASRPLLLKGRLFWKQLPDSGNASGALARSDSNLSSAGDGHSPLIVPAAVPTTIRPTPIEPANAMRIELPVRFSVAGSYVLQWRYGKILRRISPPFSVIPQPDGSLLPVADSRWISAIPDDFYKARAPGYISDYMRQTGIRRFLADISLGRPPAPFPAIPDSTGRLVPIARRIHTLGGQVVVRLNLFCKNGHRLPKYRWLAARLTLILTRLSPDISAIVVNPIGLNVPSRMALALRGVKLAAAQRAYRNMVRLAAKMLPNVPVVPQLKSLGAASYCPLDPGLFNASNAKHKSLIFAVSDNRRWLPLMHTVSRMAHPPVIWVLPVPAQRLVGISLQTEPVTRPHKFMGAAMALAAGAMFAPAREGRCFSATAHWLGDAVRFAPVHSHLPPTMTVFQANKRAVAIVIGLGAGTIHDTFWRAWQWGHVQWRRVGPSYGGRVNAGWHHLSTGEFPTGHLTIFDPEAVLQSFNAVGQKLSTPFPGEQQIPLNARTYFVTAPGSARNLVAALRTAEIHGFPPALIFPQLFTDHKVAGPHGLAGTISGQTEPKTRRFIATDAISHGIDGIQVRWIIRNAGVGRLDGLFRTSIQTELGIKNRPDVKSVAQTTWKWLEIPSGQFRTLSITIPENVYRNGLILRASLRGASFQEQVALPLAAVDPSIQRTIGNRPDRRK